MLCVYMLGTRTVAAHMYLSALGIIGVCFSLSLYINGIKVILLSSSLCNKQDLNCLLILFSLVCS